MIILVFWKERLPLFSFSYPQPINCYSIMLSYLLSLFIFYVYFFLMFLLLILDQLLDLLGSIRPDGENNSLVFLHTILDVVDQLQEAADGLVSVVWFLKLFLQFILHLRLARPLNIATFYIQFNIFLDRFLHMFLLVDRNSFFLKEMGHHLWLVRSDTSR